VFSLKKEQGFSISSAISVQNEAVGRRKKARRGCPKSIVILNLFQHLLNTVMLNLFQHQLDTVMLNSIQHPLNTVMLNVVACNRFQHLSYRGDPESSSG